MSGVNIAADLLSKYFEALLTLFGFLKLRGHLCFLRHYRPWPHFRRRFSLVVDETRGSNDTKRARRLELIAHH
jgi:hypothetical protein